jgi:hypothetical protein
LSLLLDGCGGLSFALAEVVQLCPADFAPALDFDFCNARGVYGEYAFDAFAVTDAANGEVRIQAGALAADDDAAIYLNALLVTFDDPAMNLDRIAYAKLRDILLELLPLDFVNHAHALEKSRTSDCGATPPFSQGSISCNERYTTGVEAVKTARHL